MSAIGFAITNITSKFGLISTKAAKRLATEAGKKLVDRTNELGRELNEADIKEVFEKTLPKCCRPRVIGNEEQLNKFLTRNYGKSLAQDIGEDIKEAVAEYCPSVFVRGPIWLPVKDIVSNKHFVPAVTAHELFHALEGNNTYYGLLKRKVWLPYKVLRSIYRNLMKIPDYSNNFEHTVFDEVYCKMTETSATEFAKAVLNGEYENRIRSVIRKVIDPRSNNTSRYDYINSRVLQIKPEIGAYDVGAQVERYGLKIGDSEVSIQEARSIFCQEVKRILKEEEELFLKNKLSGRLK